MPFLLYWDGVPRLDNLNLEVFVLQWHFLLKISIAGAVFSTEVEKPVLFPEDPLCDKLDGLPLSERLAPPPWYWWDRIKRLH